MPAKKATKKPTTKPTSKKPTTKKPPRKSGPGREARFDLAARLAALPPATKEKAPDMPAAALGKDMQELARVLPPYVGKIGRVPDTDQALIAELGPRAEALLAADLSLKKKRKVEAKGSGREPIERATRLRRQLLDGARHLFRRTPEVLAQLDAIAEGEGLDDLIQDLGDFADLIDAFPERFALDDALPENPAAAVRAMAAELVGRTDTSVVAAAVAHRNECFWLANEAFEEAYAALGFVLRGGRVDRSDLFRPYRARNQAALRARASRKARAGGTGNA